MRFSLYTDVNFSKKKALAQRFCLVKSLCFAITWFSVNLLFAGKLSTLDDKNLNLSLKRALPRTVSFSRNTEGISPKLSRDLYRTYSGCCVEGKLYDHRAP